MGGGSSRVSHATSKVCAELGECATVGVEFKQGKYAHFGVVKHDKNDEDNKNFMLVKKVLSDKFDRTHVVVHLEKIQPCLFLTSAQGAVTILEGKPSDVKILGVCDEQTFYHTWGNLQSRVDYAWCDVSLDDATISAKDFYLTFFKHASLLASLMGTEHAIVVHQAGHEPLGD
jgi:hypothetical protein